MQPLRRRPLGFLCLMAFGWMGWLFLFETHVQVFHGLFLRVELTDRHGHVTLAFDDFKVGLFFCH